MRKAKLRVACAIYLLASIHLAVAIDDVKIPEVNNDPVPLGMLPPVYRIPGVRGSATLATVVHCTNLEITPVTFFVSFYQYTGSLQCSISIPIAASGTRSLATSNVAAFSLDNYCAPAAAVGQGQALVAVSPVGSRVVCSSEIVSVTVDPPTTLTALDIYRAN